MRLRGFVSLTAAACLAALTATAPAWAGPGYHLFGKASYITPGEGTSNRAVQLIADASANPQVYSGIDFDVPSGITIGQLNTLQTDFNVTAGDCGEGSPRFAIGLANLTGHIFVYLGPAPNYTGCTPNSWTSSGNLLASGSTVDASQLGGGFYEKWSDVQTQFSGAVVSDIFLVSDNGTPANSQGLGGQTVDIDNTNVNGTLYTYEQGEGSDCKAGGWRNFPNPPGPFANQGGCVSYFATQQ